MSPRKKVLSVINLDTTAQLKTRGLELEARGLRTPYRLAKLPSQFRVRQRSGEGVVRRNGCPKGCFWRVRFFSAPLSFALKKKQTKCPEDLKGAEEKRTLQKRPFGQPFLRTTPSPLLWCTLYYDDLPLPRMKWESIFRCRRQAQP